MLVPASCAPIKCNVKPESESKRDSPEWDFGEYANEQPGRVLGGTQPDHLLLDKKGAQFSRENKSGVLIMAILICFSVLLAIFLILT